MCTCAACAVDRMYAPPAIVFWQLWQFQMPTTDRFTLSFPQKTHVYFECWLTSIFFTCLRSEAPYRTPYFPVMPAFLVRCETRDRKGRGMEGRVSDELGEGRRARRATRVAMGHRVRISPRKKGSDLAPESPGKPRKRFGSRPGKGFGSHPGSTLS